jgi:AraC family transcriptional regulator
MRQEVREGCSSGRLYGESISLALLAYLAGAYANARQVEPRTAALSPAQKRSVIAYIRANLAGSVSVSELAGLMHMSPSHFARVFKASFEVSPYRFIMQERIEGAKAMLASTEMTSSQVAISFGFAARATS